MKKESPQKILIRAGTVKAMENIVKKNITLHTAMSLKLINLRIVKQYSLYLFQRWFYCWNKSAEAGKEEFSIDFKVKNLTRQRIYESAEMEVEFNFQKMKLLQKVIQRQLKMKILELIIQMIMPECVRIFIVKNKPVGRKVEIKISRRYKIKMIARADNLCLKMKMELIRWNIPLWKCLMQTEKSCGHTLKRAMTNYGLQFRIKNKDVISGKIFTHQSSLVTISI